MIFSYKDIISNKLKYIRNQYLYVSVTQNGEAYIYNCPYSSLCRQVVIDEEGRVKSFNFKDMANPTVEMTVS